MGFGKRRDKKQEESGSLSLWAAGLVTKTRRMNVRTGVRKIALAAAAGAALMLGTAQAARASNEDVVVVKAAKVVTVSGEDIPQGEIVIIDGKVRLVGRKLEYPKGATIIDATRDRRSDLDEIVLLLVRIRVVALAPLADVLIVGRAHDRTPSHLAAAVATVVSLRCRVVVMQAEGMSDLM